MRNKKVNLKNQKRVSEEIPFILLLNFFSQNSFLEQHVNSIFNIK